MNRVREQIRSMLQVEGRDSGFRATLRIDPGFMLLPDHFAATPIFPGICLIQAVLVAGAQAEGVPDLRLCAVKRAKFQAPAQVGDVVDIDADVSRDEKGGLSIRATLLVLGKKLAQISLVAMVDAMVREAGQ